MLTIKEIKRVLLKFQAEALKTLNIVSILNLHFQNYKYTIFEHGKQYFYNEQKGLEHVISSIYNKG